MSNDEYSLQPCAKQVHLPIGDAFTKATAHKAMTAAANKVVNERIVRFFRLLLIRLKGCELVWFGDLDGDLASFKGLMAGYICVGHAHSTWILRICPSNDARPSWLMVLRRSCQHTVYSRLLSLIRSGTPGGWKIKPNCRSCRGSQCLRLWKQPYAMMTNISYAT
jgi:hypothetical protein